MVGGANHLCRVLPPSSSKAYSEAHDAAVWTTFCKLAQAEELAGDKVAQDVATLPTRLGGLGLRSATFNSTGAYWGSWADGLSVLAKKFPDLAALAVHHLEGDAEPKPDCLQQLSDCARRLRTTQTEELPTWTQLAGD